MQSYGKVATVKGMVKKDMQNSIFLFTIKPGLNFKNPNEIVSEYFSKCNICLDN